MTTQDPEAAFEAWFSNTIGIPSGTMQKETRELMKRSFIKGWKAQADAKASDHERADNKPTLLVAWMQANNIQEAEARKLVRKVWFYRDQIEKKAAPVFKPETKNDSVKEEVSQGNYTLLCRIDELKKRLEFEMEVNCKLSADLMALKDENRWIPVTERLPIMGEYLVLSSTSFCTILNFDSLRWFTEGGTKDEYWNKFITHWRPLPAPPKPTSDTPTTDGVSPTPPPSEVAHAPKSD